MPEQVSAAEAYHRVKQREREIAEYMVSRDWLAEFALHGDDAEAVPPLLRLVNEKLAELQRGMKGAQG